MLQRYLSQLVAGTTNYIKETCTLNMDGTSLTATVVRMITKEADEKCFEMRQIFGFCEDALIPQASERMTSL